LYNLYTGIRINEEALIHAFEAVGGHTLVSRDPTVWAKSVVDHSLWRVIEYDDFESVICLLTEEQQNVLKDIIACNVEQLSKNTKIMPFQGDGTPYEPFNTFAADFQQKLYE
jgi:hypothetical protein